MPSLDLALCHRMIGLAADVAHAPIVEPIGKLCGDIGWPVIAEQTRTLIYAINAHIHVKMTYNVNDLVPSPRSLPPMDLSSLSLRTKSCTTTF